MSRSEASLPETAQGPQTWGQERGRAQDEGGGEPGPRPAHQRVQRRSDEHKTELPGKLFPSKAEELDVFLMQWGVTAGK